MAGDPLPDPLGLPQLRLWIAQMISSYEAVVANRQFDCDNRDIKLYLKSLNSVRKTCDGDSRSYGKRQLRELIAMGALNYGWARTPHPEDSIPEQVVIDFAVFALWPVVISPKLPGSWYSKLIDMTSPPGG
jgi:hypothetical protein